MISEDQLPDNFSKIIDEQVEVYGKGRSVQLRNKIPDTTQIPIENPTHWLKIPNVICVFVDMMGSTKLSASNHDESTAGAYQLFTRTAVRLFSEFEAPYIDVRGDGVLALFDEDQTYRAIAATITFKTFSELVFTPIIKKKTDLEIKAHYGIDQSTVLVRKIGFKRHRGRSDRQNEVWAGKPVNMAAKLAGISNGSEILVSDRFFKNIDNDLVLNSCGCPDGKKVNLWSEINLSTDERFNFDTAFSNSSYWCKTHGEEFCERILNLDND
jgi:class 3 adenylate cyclase